MLPGWAREELEARFRPRAPAAAEQAPLELGVPVVLDVVVRPPRELRGDGRPPAESPRDMSKVLNSRL